MRLVVLVAALSACSSGKPAKQTTVTSAPKVNVDLSAVTADVKGEKPGDVLIARERDVWMLEGKLVEETDAALRAPEAAQVVGDPKKLRYSENAEGKLRAYLRGKRSQEVRTRATEVVKGLNRPTRVILDEVAKQTGLTPEDVFLDYLTYDGLYDLAMMRYGYKRWKAGSYSAETKALADSFFSAVAEIPSAKRGIKVVSAKDGALEVNMFGANLVAKVDHEEVRDLGGVGRVGVVEWTSNYEQLRAAVRGTPAKKQIEELEWDRGNYLVNYAVELDEYLTWGSTNPWATVLFLSSADEVADMYAGAAAAGGFETTSAAKLDNIASLPTAGTLGSAQRGLAFKILDVKTRPRLGATTPRRGQFVVVTVEARSTLATDMRAPAEWFKLANKQVEYPELGVARPGIAPSVLATAPKGATMLGMPYTTVGAGKTVTLVLVYDVPTEHKTNALVIGADELALRVATN